MYWASDPLLLTEWSPGAKENLLRSSQEALPAEEYVQHIQQALDILYEEVGKSRCMLMGPLSSQQPVCLLPYGGVAAWVQLGKLCSVRCTLVEPPPVSEHLDGMGGRERPSSSAGKLQVDQIALLGGKELASAAS